MDPFGLAAVAIVLLISFSLLAMDHYARKQDRRDELTKGVASTVFKAKKSFRI
jgi:hypothetical protein